MLGAGSMRGGKNALCRLLAIATNAGLSRSLVLPAVRRLSSHEHQIQQQQLMAFVEQAKRINDVEGAREFYAEVRRSSVSHRRYLQNAVIQMFGRCKSLGDARAVFKEMYYKDVHTYNMMFQALGESGGSDKEALQIFREMQAESDVKPNQLTFMRLLQIESENLSFYKTIQASIAASAEIKFSVNLTTKLIAIFTRFNAMEEAESIFQAAPEKPTGMYNAMLQCYLQNSRHADVVNLFEELQKQDRELPDERTYAQAVVACGQLGWLGKGRQIHELMIEDGCVDAHGAAALISMYGRCGELEVAKAIFQAFPTPDLPLWNAMIYAFAINGEISNAFHHLTQLWARGFTPNAVTYGALLPMCATFGLLDEAEGCLKAMVATDVTVNIGHHCSMVHLLGRLGKFEMADKYIKGMSMRPDAAIWVALLSACRALFYSGHAPEDCLEVAERAVAAAVELCPDNAPAYLLMADIYEMAGDWEASKHWSELMEVRGIRKEPAKSVIEIPGGKVRAFQVGIPEEVQIDTDGDPSAKHSEQIAVAFGLQNTPAGETLRLTCNHLMCKACHTKMKQLSSDRERTIVVRDADLVHTFIAGACSCNDAKY